MFAIISFFPKIDKGGGSYNKSEGLENFSKTNKRRGDDYSVLESNYFEMYFLLQLLT